MDRPPPYSFDTPTLAFNTPAQQYIRHNKRGKIVMRKIDKVQIGDLIDITDDVLLRRANKKEPVHGKASKDSNNNKEPILQLLRDAGITEGIDIPTQNMLPTWKEVQELYYQSTEGPIVIGTCDHIVLSKKLLGVAGLFNSGTNTLTYYLRANFVQPMFLNESHQGILTQVPWGKHWFQSLRHEHTVDFMASLDKSQVVPIVVIRDPYTWWQSMCESPYLVQWKDSRQSCHTLNNLSSVYMPQMTGPQRVWPTLLHIWQDWYNDYVQSKQPYLMIRFEDLIWKPRQTLQNIQTCTGASWKQDHFVYVVDRSKWEHVRFHGPQSNLISAMIKHGNKYRRIRNLTRTDLQQAGSILDSDKALLQQFGYSTANFLSNVHS
jgi:hypothetical protein